MQVLFSDVTFSYLFPGGKQVHAAKLMQHLQATGIDVEYENWHNPQLKADVIHCFGFNDFHKLQALKEKGYKLVYTHILDGLTNLSTAKQQYHRQKNRLIRYLPPKFNSLFPWRGLHFFDAIVYMHENDRKTALKLYDVDPARTHVIPHAVDSLEQFRGGTPETSPRFLVSVGSIVERKNPAFLAAVCRDHQIPIRFIGHPFDEQSNYFKTFLSCIDHKTTQYSGFVTEQEKIEWMKKASGFVLLSHGESGCISVYEAGAAGLPLLLSDLPWAKGYEQPERIEFCSPNDAAAAGATIRRFYENAQRQQTPSFAVHTWDEIAKRYAQVYRSVLPS